MNVVPYALAGVVLFAAMIGGWYWLTSRVLRYVRTAYPEQAYELPQTLLTGEGWNSAEMKLMRSILFLKGVYAYDAYMKQYRVLLLAYIVLCIIIGAGYVLVPVLVR